MTAKKTETKAEEIVKEEAVVEETKKEEANCINPCGYYIPLELRNKLEYVACKMVDKLANFSGEYNANQLKSLETAMEIYRTIRY